MNVDGPNDKTYEMKSRTDLARFIYALQDDFKHHPENWENQALHTFLGAFARFLNDAQGYYQSENLDIDADVPSWRLIADCLQAATCYD